MKTHFCQKLSLKSSSFCSLYSCFIFLFGDIFFFLCIIFCLQKFFLQRIFILFMWLWLWARFRVVAVWMSGSSFFFCDISLLVFRFVWFGSLAFHLHRVTVSRFRIYSICYARCAAYSSDYIKINGYQKLCVFLVWENEIEEEKENGNWIGTVACNCILDQEFTNKNVMNVAVFSI